MCLSLISFLQNPATNKQISLYYHVQHVLSHQLYSLRGHHIGNISSPTVTNQQAFNYFPLFLFPCSVITFYFCCCQYQLLSSTFNLLPTVDRKNIIDKVSWRKLHCFLIYSVRNKKKCMIKYLYIFFSSWKCVKLIAI